MLSTVEELETSLEKSFEVDEVDDGIEVDRNHSFQSNKLAGWGFHAQGWPDQQTKQQKDRHILSWQAFFSIDYKLVDNTWICYNNRCKVWICPGGGSSEGNLSGGERQRTKRGIAWNSMELRGIARNCQEFPGIARNFHKLSGIVRNCQELPGIVRNYQEWPGITRNCLESPGIAGLFSAVRKSLNWFPAARWATRGSAGITSRISPFMWAAGRNKERDVSLHFRGCGGAGNGGLGYQAHQGTIWTRIWLRRQKTRILTQR